MERLLKFCRLPVSKQILLIQTVAILGAVRASLWLLPFKMLRRISVKLVRPHASGDGAQFSTEHKVWAVQVASRYVPRATCLAQALALHILLRRSGLQSRIRIGVAKETQFEAHAWVECQGKVVIGDSGVERYSPIVVWD